MQTPRPDFRNAIRRITTGPDAAIYAILAVVLVLQSYPRVASVLGSAMASSFSSSAPANRLVLKTAAYCDEMPARSVTKTVTVEEMPEVASDEMRSKRHEHGDGHRHSCTRPAVPSRSRPATASWIICRSAESSCIAGWLPSGAS